MNTSAVPISRNSACFAAASRRSNAMERLFRLVFKNETEGPLRRLLAPARGITTVGILDLDHVRSLIREDHRGQGPPIRCWSDQRYGSHAMDPACRAPKRCGLTIPYRRSEAKTSSLPVPNLGAALRIAGRAPSNDSAEPVSL